MYILREGCTEPHGRCEQRSEAEVAGAHGHPLATIYIYPGFLGLQEITPGSITTLNESHLEVGGTPDDQISVKFGSGDKSLRIASANGDFQVKDPSEAADGLWRSSEATTHVVTGSHELADVLDGVETQRDDHLLAVSPTEVLVSRSMTHGAPDDLQVEERLGIDPSPPASADGKELVVDRILETPAVATRYVKQQENAGQGLDGSPSWTDASASHLLSSAASPSIRKGQARARETTKLCGSTSHASEGENPPSRTAIAAARSSPSPGAPTVSGSERDESDLVAAVGRREGFFGNAAAGLSGKRKRITTYRAKKPKRLKDDLERDSAGGNAVEEGTDLARAGEETPGTPSRPTTADREAILESPSVLVESVGSSNKKRKTATPGRPSTEKYDGPPPCIVFSNSVVPDKSRMMAFLKRHRAAKADIRVDDFNFVCVGNGELKRTSKLVLGVALGKTIVTDKWVTDSVRAGSLLDPAGYLPRDEVHEREWRFDLEEAVERGRKGVKAFEGCTVYLTTSVCKNSPEVATELKRMMHLTGARSIRLYSPETAPPGSGEPSPSASGAALLVSRRRVPPFVIGAENDPDAARLSKLGWTVYTRDIVSLSILRGRLEIYGDEFRMAVPEHTSTKRHHTPKSRNARTGAPFSIVLERQDD